MDFECAKKFVDILQNFYPEILHQLLLVNAPFIFYAFWQLVRVLLDPVTANKVKFITLDQLGEYVSEDQWLPGGELGMSAAQLKQRKAEEESAQSAM